MHIFSIPKGQIRMNNFQKTNEVEHASADEESEKCQMVPSRATYSYTDDRAMIAVSF